MQNQFVIQNLLGLHVRPAKAIVASASQFNCAIHLEKGGARFSAKSLIGVLSAGIKFGDTVTLIAEGEGEAEAMKTIGDLLASPIEENPAKKVQQP
ncbi:HPr family phosphocarrier protein [Cohnella sp. JJ-181]|uniref:HPr family phosphocarrier protein n=1 Tax=Cohnella rhizoplanae TaxID=2974897 RepID=UPI0022FF88EF|nr:HPr family phosphocarrier protein [Cohnella sp. JJ-181]CAI6084875.1 Phosphocarrier protein HPr [Cohnella sp. JJ-181]